MPVHGAGASPNPICSAPARSWRTLTEFVAAARAMPDRFFDGSGIPLWPEMGTRQFAAFLVEELPRVAALIRRSGVRPE